MKYNWVIATALFFFVMAVVLISNATRFLWKGTSLNYHSEDPRAYHYHFAMITRATEEDYWSRVHQGAMKVAVLNKVALEYYGPRFQDPKELERFLEMAVLSSVDGILVSVPNSPEFKALIHEADAKNIPVITLSNDIDDVNRNSFVGVNAYKLGLKTGQALAEAVSGDVEAAVLVSSDFSPANAQRYLQGIQKAIDGHPGLQLKLILKSKGSSISAEEQTQSILTNHPEIRAIVCSNASDTLGVAKVVVDLNRVTQVTIIGSGLTAEIANYIRLGVIRGVLADDPYSLGTRAMSVLIRIREGQIRKEDDDMPLFLVNGKNVNAYAKLLIPTVER